LVEHTTENRGVLGSIPSLAILLFSASKLSQGASYSNGCRQPPKSEWQSLRGHRLGVAGHWYWSDRWYFAGEQAGSDRAAGGHSHHLRVAEVRPTLTAACAVALLSRGTSWVAERGAQIGAVKSHQDQRLAERKGAE